MSRNTLKMSRISKDMAHMMHLLQLSDSALPVGMFSFSAGLESAVTEGLVADRTTLRSFIYDAVERTLHSDCIVALAAHRASRSGNYALLRYINEVAELTLLSDERRLMSQRMGRKLLQLATEITQHRTILAWANATNRDNITPSLAATQGVIFAAAGLGERQMTSSLLYSAASMILGAALRLMRISHIETQRILYAIGSESGELFDRIVDSDIDDVCSFAPQTELCTSLHERGTNRMFMS